MKNLTTVIRTIILVIFLSSNLLAQTKKQYNVVVFGNSIVEQGNWEKVLDRQDVLKYGLPGQVTGQLIWNIKNVLKDYPGTKIWFLEGGINDISLGVPVKRIFENQQVIIDSLKRNNIIPVVQSTILKYNSKEDNKKVNQLNKKIKAFCEQNNIEYIDLNAFLSRNGELIMDLSTDGCHLKPQAYVPWGEAIKKVLAKLNI
jgi:lysophospholipase L1-like esterase